MSKILIKNVNIVLKNYIIYNGSVLIKDDIFSVITRSNINICDVNATIIDGTNKWLLPGLIDLHNDAIEKEIEPRPLAILPFEPAFFSLENRLLINGVTTIFHSISFIDEKDGIRSKSNLKKIIQGIHKVSECALIRHYVHARYEVIDIDLCMFLINLIDKGYIQLLSFMDHSPGQGQYKNADYLRIYLSKHEKKSDKEIDEIIKLRINKKETNNNGIYNSLLKLKEKAKELNIPIASHDDDSEQKIDDMIELGVNISEFPIDVETACYAKKRGMHVIGGAPNVIRGESTSGNMKVIEGIENNTIDIICSDYLPSGMLNAIFILKNKYKLHFCTAVNMVSYNPAIAVNLDHVIGAIEEGKKADCILVNEFNGLPHVEKVIIDGRLVLDKNELNNEIETKRNLKLNNKILI